MPAASVPTFFLYGEPHRRVSPDFLHLEALADRSRPPGWTIRPHAHADLHQLFLIASGAGRMQADGLTHGFAAPCLLFIPARTVHGFTWEPETGGQVLTLADGVLRNVLSRHSGLAELFATAHCAAVPNAADLAGHLDALGHELAWPAPGHDAALEAGVLQTFVAALRLQRRDGSGRLPEPGRAGSLVARFRLMVEAEYRCGLSIADIAGRLGVAPATLRRACLRMAGCTPTAILQQRLFLEAQRMLHYTGRSVAETAAALGFEDVAYFTRFFTRHAGCPPGRFRKKGQGSALHPEGD